jgi:hypothetical protein
MLQEIEEMKHDLMKKEEAIAAYQQTLDSWSEKFHDLLARQKDIILTLNFDDTVNETNDDEMG